MSFYLDKTLPAATRAQLLLEEMSIEEKMAQTVGLFPFTLDMDEAFSDAPLGVGNVSCLMAVYMDSAEKAADFVRRFQQETMRRSPHHIPAMFHMEGLCGAPIFGCPSFPSGIARGASFDPELEEKIAGVISKSERALGVTETLAPVLDVSREPRMGRHGESYGEDQTLAAAMGSAYVKGVQSDQRADGLRSESCAKHFMGFHTGMGGVHGAESEVSRRTLLEVYGKSFQAAIQNSGLREVMPCYNTMNGVDASVSEELLTDILRNEMGFEGIAVSDYSALSNAFFVDKVGENAAETGYMGMLAGMNQELPDKVCFNDELCEKFKDGTYDVSVLNQAVFKILEAKFRMGLFECPYPLSDEEILEEIHSEGENELSLQSAREGLVLLKNDGVLPLKKEQAAGKKIAVIGQQAKDPKILFGGYTHFSFVEGSAAARQSMAGIGNIDAENGIDVVTYPGSGVEMDKPAFNDLFDLHHPGTKSVLEALKEAYPDSVFLYAYGFPVVGNDMSHHEEALKVIKEADLVVLCLGGKYSQGSQSSMGEGIDGTDINLPVCQEEFIRKAAEYGKPMIGIHLGGRPISSDAADAHINAILEAWAPGEFGGIAIAEAISGKLNPSGKLPVSIAYNAGQIPVYYSHKYGSATHQGLSIGFREYVDCPHSPRYAFGHGLSYTEFTYSNLRVEKQELGPNEALIAYLTVENTGEAAGTETVQFYVRDEHASVVRPNMELTGFVKVALAPGEKKRIAYELPMSELAFLDPRMKWKIEKGEETLLVGNASDDIRLTETFTITESAFIKGKDRAFFGKGYLV